MPYGANEYINNAVVHDLVDHLMENPIYSFHVSIDEKGRKWTVGKTDYSINDVNSAKRGAISQLFTKAYISIMSFFSSKFRQNFNRAIFVINAKNDNATQLATGVASATLKKLNIDEAKQAKINKTVGELNELRAKLEVAEGELTPLEEQLKEYQQPIEDLKSQIINLNDAFKPGVIEKFEGLITMHEAKQKEVRKLKEDHDEAKLFLEDKTKTTLKSFHPKTMFKDIKELEAEEKVLRDKLELAERELSRINDEINRELEPFSVGYPTEGLTAGKCRKFFEDKIISLNKEKMAMQEETNKDWADLKTKISDKNEKINELQDECAQKEREIIALGGDVPPVEVEEATPAPISPHKQSRELFLDDDTASEPEVTEEPFVKEVNIATEIIETKYPNINQAIKEIHQKTGSVHLANVWARLLGKFGDQFGDIVQSVDVKGSQITINLKPVKGRPNDEQYRMWIPSSKNEEGIVEPKGGVILMLGNKIVLDASSKKLNVKEGYKNFVKVPDWVPSAFGEFSDAKTSVMNESENDKIGITVNKKVLLFNITKERVTLHSRLDHNWEERGQVVTNNEKNEAVIRQHIDANDYTAE